MVMISTQVSELELEDFQGKVTQNVVLPNVSWQTYKALLADMGDHRATRLTYNRGVLQIKMPSKLHEIINRLLARIVTTLSEELDLDVINMGSTTLEREELDKGAEPDTCFYIQNANQLEGLRSQLYRVSIQPRLSKGICCGTQPIFAFTPNSKRKYCNSCCPILDSERVYLNEKKVYLL
jgi:Uma2 family endonuclease